MSRIKSLNMTSIGDIMIELDNGITTFLSFGERGNILIKYSNLREKKLVIDESRKTSNNQIHIKVEDIQYMRDKDGYITPSFKKLVEDTLEYVKGGQKKVKCPVCKARFKYTHVCRKILGHPGITRSYALNPPKTYLDRDGKRRRIKK